MLHYAEGRIRHGRRSTMHAQTRKQSRWSFWRFVRWGLFLMAMVFVLPVLVWFIANRFDESPTQEALDYAAESPRQVADADNAWLLLAGIGAAAGEDPLVFGRRRVDRVVARSHESPMPPPDAAEVALFVDPVPKVGPDIEIDGVGELCPSRDVDCIAWARENTGMLERLRAANSLRLTRWQTALTLPDWQALYPPLLDGPVQDPSVATLYLNLLALELSQTLPFMPPNGVVIESTEPTTLEKLAQTVVFWRRVQVSPQDLISTLVAGRQIEDAQRIADNWLSMRIESVGRVKKQRLIKFWRRPAGPPNGVKRCATNSVVFSQPCVIRHWGLGARCGNVLMEPRSKDV
ncbi:MAG: hypothetical protein IPK97_19025 [Ahniella sp.]|nr:hypothetical protein [Ahniella sp.]